MKRPLRIAVDTMVFIYLGQKHPEYFERVRDHLRKADEVIFSTMGYGEVLAGFEKQNDLQGKLAFVNMFEVTKKFRLISFDPNAALTFAKIRAKYPKIKSPDAIHLATAQQAGVDYFLTNDSGLQAFEELEVKCL